MAIGISLGKMLAFLGLSPKRRPFECITQMQAKDISLWNAVKKMPIQDATKAWRKVYPEDFVSTENG